MSWWNKVKSRWSGASTKPVAEDGSSKARPVEPAPPLAAEVDENLARLEQLDSGRDVGEELALSALALARGTSRERAALELVRRAARKARAGEALRTAAAELYLARGQSDVAVELLSGVRSTPALLLAAEVHAERKELSRAVSLVERVLARDIDAPGARERHERWRRALGGAQPAPALLDQPTVLTAGTPETTLRIVGEAGRGGAGTVYEAIDDGLGRRVALKVYHRPDQDRDKLEREARTAVRFVGRGVVRVFDVNVERGFIVMEWLPGRALKQWIVRKDASFLWPVERWLIPLSQALARVHACGAVHGDIKPANVLFRSVGDPVLTDFGLARDVGEALPGGSLGYMSPERLDDPSATPADDVYAVGRLLEDVLEALGPSAPELGATTEATRWHAVLPQLLASAEVRPADAGRLLSLLSG